MGVIRFLGQHKGAVALVMLLLLLKAGCELAIPVLTSQIVDVGIAQSGVEDLDVLEGYKAAGVDLFPIQMAYLLRIGGLMLLAAAGSMVLDVAAGFVSARTGAKIGRDLRRRLFARVVAFSDAEINQFSAASLITRGTNDIHLVQMVTVMLLRMVLYAPILAIGGIIMVSRTNLAMSWIIVLAVAGHRRAHRRADARGAAQVQDHADAHRPREPRVARDAHGPARHPRVRPPALRGEALRRGQHASS